MDNNSQIDLFGQSKIGLYAFSLPRKPSQYPHQSGL
jgi:hypothetical protein